MLPTSSEGKLWKHEVRELLVKRINSERLRRDILNCNQQTVWERLRRQGLPAPRVLRCYQNSLWLEQRWIAGQILPDFLRQQQASRAEILRIFDSALVHLQLALQAGIAHGDLAPSNLVITPDRRGLWIDWTTARLFGAYPHRGNFEYMAPALKRGQPLSIKTEMYAFDKVLRVALQYR